MQRCRENTLPVSAPGIRSLRGPPLTERQAKWNNSRLFLLAAQLVSNSERHGSVPDSSTQRRNRIRVVGKQSFCSVRSGSKSPTSSRFVPTASKLPHTTWKYFHQHLVFPNSHVAHISCLNELRGSRCFGFESGVIGSSCAGVALEWLVCI